MASTTARATIGGMKTIPRTWSWRTIPLERTAATHQRVAPLAWARQAQPSARAAKSGMGLGFQMKVDSSIAAGETARRRPAIAAVTGPPTILANHHVAANAANPVAAIQAPTAVGGAAAR